MIKNIILTAKKNYFKINFLLTSNKFMEAGHYGNARKVQWYIDNGVDPDTSYPDGTTLLHHMCISKNMEMVNLLLKNKANPNALYQGELTPLLMVAQDASNKFIKDDLSMLNNRIKDNIKKETAFIIAKSLIEAGANINAVNKNGNNALVSACSHTNEKLVDTLLAAGIDRGVGKQQEVNPFLIAVFYQNKAITHSLISATKSIAEIDHYLSLAEKMHPQFVEDACQLLKTTRLKMKLESKLKEKPIQKLKKI